MKSANGRVNETADEVPQAPHSTKESLQLSRSEVESLTLKAARGAGMSWGLAEEAGFACGWLAARGLDGTGALALHLQQVQGIEWQQRGLSLKFEEWLTHWRERLICPVWLGATLSDFACADQALFSFRGLRLGKVSYPYLLIPFIAIIAVDLKKTLSIQLDNCHVFIDSDSRVAGDLGCVHSIEISTVIITDISENAASDISCWQNCSIEAQAQRRRVSAVAEDAFQLLQQFALRTTVPSSIDSRANAGACSSDND